MPITLGLPVIFLAFSGVAVGDYIPLPRLADEASQLRAVFRSAKRAGQCDFELLENATLTQILDTFQDPDLHDRIVVFHYAGHADSYSLLLQEAKGKDVLVNADGLAAFFAQQEGLRLVFLNGCSTEAQVAELHAAGVPAVIAATEDVLDDWAEQFAVRFYKGLVGGATVVTAFAAARAEIEARYGQQEKWPWRLHLRHEADGAWALTRTAAGEDKLPVEGNSPAEGGPSAGRGALLARLAEAIQGAYDRDELRRALRLGMNETLDALVADRSFQHQVFELIEWAERRGRLEELVACLHARNQGNKLLAAVYGDVVKPQAPPSAPLPNAGASAAAQPAAQPSTPPAEPAAAQPAAHPDGGRQVFLAYSRKDAEFMRRLRADLLAEGIDVWVDDQDLEPGTLLWQRAIQRAIRTAQCMIAVLSPEACESEWVNSEITLAKKRHLRIFPVLVRGEEDDAVPLALVSVQHVDARSDYEGAVKGRLLPAVRKHLGLTPPADQGAPPQLEPQRTETEARPPQEPEKPAVQAPAVLMPKTFTLPPLDIEWITIPAGEFLMGSDQAQDPGAYEDEMPQHGVYLPEYSIARYPVTNAQYAEFVKAAGYRPPRHWGGGEIPAGKHSHPVVGVSWNDATAYCAWASQVTNRLVRLPSEAEWEKAARGIDGRIWPWGNSTPTGKLGNFGTNVRDTTPVAKHPAGASPYGVMDMAGNVWEWTRSLWGEDSARPTYRYPYVPSDGREQASAADPALRVVRGGAFRNDTNLARCAARGGSNPYSGYTSTGFRVALSLPIADR